jgi:xylanolytic transcriptional activator XlnR
LTYIIFCIAISGGDFKADCLKWWDKANRAASCLGLNREDEPCQLPGPTCPKLLCECRFQHSDPPLAIVEAKEERRRVFWLLYSLDRHLSLSYNKMLRIPDSSCQVYGLSCP